jgi:hypothetical protein
MPDSAKTAWRRLYVFVAVALAVFLAVISSIGLVCHGFATAPAGNQASVEKHSTNTPVPVPPELKVALTKAQQRGQQAYQAVQAAVDQYQATDVELQDLLNSHFEDLLQAATAAAKAPVPANAAPMLSAIPETNSNALDERTPEFSAPTAPTSIINPRYQDLEDEIVQLRRQRTVLSEKLLPTHPEMQKIDDSLSELEDRIRSVQKEIPGPVPVHPMLSSSEPNGKQPELLEPKPIASPASAVFATLLPRWQKVADDYRELTDRLQTEKNACYDALNHESATWKRKAEIPADYLATLTTTQTTVQLRGADPKTAIYWSGFLALIAAVLVARHAQVSEAVFQTAAQVRQRLAVTIIGFLPRRPDYLARVNSGREPRWIRRLLLAAELYLAVIVLALMVLSLADHQFFNHLIANPLTACSQKFWS